MRSTNKKEKRDNTTKIYPNKKITKIKWEEIFETKEYLKQEILTKSQRRHQYEMLFSWRPKIKISARRIFEQNILTSTKLFEQEQGRNYNTSNKKKS